MPIPVLIIEDDPADRLILRRQLERTRLDVVPDMVATVASAREKLRSGHYELALVDHFLPDGHGSDLIAERTAAGCSTSYIALTSLDDEQLEADALSSGAVDFIPKEEVTVSALKRAIRSAISRGVVRREIEALARTDGLTGLWNRSHFLTQVESALARHRRTDRPFSLLYLDLDGFKPINDQMGHHVGDLLLKAFAARLQALVRDTDVVARLGGDEFAVMLDLMTDRDDGAPTAERLADALQEPYEVEGRTVRVGTTIGVSTCPEDGDTVEDLLSHADHAMLARKRLKPGSRERLQPAARQVVSNHSELQFARWSHLGERRTWAVEPRLYAADGDVTDSIPLLDRVVSRGEHALDLLQQSCSRFGRFHREDPALRLVLRHTLQDLVLWYRRRDHVVAALQLAGVATADTVLCLHLPSPSEPHLRSMGWARAEGFQLAVCVENLDLHAIGRLAETVAPDIWVLEDCVRDALGARPGAAEVVGLSSTIARRTGALCAHGNLTCRNVVDDLRTLGVQLVAGPAVGRLSGNDESPSTEARAA